MRVQIGQVMGDSVWNIHNSTRQLGKKYSHYFPKLNFQSCALVIGMAWLHFLLELWTVNDSVQPRPEEKKGSIGSKSRLSVQIGKVMGNNVWNIYNSTRQLGKNIFTHFQVNFQACMWMTGLNIFLPELWTVNDGVKPKPKEKEGKHLQNSTRQPFHGTGKGKGR